MKGLIGKKIGMTSIFTDAGKQIPCTIIEAGPCVVTQVKSEASDGYNSLQIAFGEKKEKNTPNAMQQHFAKANTTPKRVVKEIRDCETEANIGDSIDCSIFAEGEKISVVGTSKGKGFQGVIKRHGFKGVGDATHGQHNRDRAPGSIGGASYPAKVFKGMRMGGRMGGTRVKVQALQIVKIFPEKNYILVNGSVPGYNGSTVLIHS